MPHDDQPPEPYGTWAWPRLPRLDSAPVVEQLHEEGCGVACAAMLLADRGIVVTQWDLADSTPMPTGAMELADALAARTGTAWAGGSLRPGARATWELIDQISRERSTWAALLEPLDLGYLGHWVVVDGISDDALVLLRDPVGRAYGTPLADFARLWGYTMLVAEEISR